MERESVGEGRRRRKMRRAEKKRSGTEVGYISGTKEVEEGVVDRVGRGEEL